MTKATTRRFFWGGTVLFTLVFIGLTIHTHTTIADRTNQENLTEEVVRGKHAWERYNCENCHTLMGEGAYYAPDLTQIVDRRGRPYLALFLENPALFYSEEVDGRLMPDLGMTAQEIEDVISFLDWVGDIDLNGWPPRPILVAGVAVRGMPGVSGTGESDQAVVRGLDLFHGDGGCAGCHALTPELTLVGSSLYGIPRTAAERIRDPAYEGSATTPEGYVKESIVEPSAYIVPDPANRYATAEGVSIMPDTLAEQLTPQQVDDLVAYLMTLQADAPERGDES